MASLADVKTNADAAFDATWSALLSAQESYSSKNGKFFQSLLSPQAVVEDGVDAPCSVRLPADEKNPSDVGTSWVGDAPFQIDIHEWVGETTGFTLIATMKLDEGLMRKHKSSDGEVSDWALVEPLPQ